MRVFDAGIWRPVPHATQLLADLGADVLKLEPPGGDPMRTFPDIFRDVASHKRSIVLDLRSDSGRARALELAARADVFCEGWRPGVADRLGMGYERLRAVNPGIIYCSVSGYGQTGARHTPRPRRELSGARGRDHAPERARRSRYPRSSHRRPRGRDGGRTRDRRGVGEQVADRRRGVHRRGDGRRRRVVDRTAFGERHPRPRGNITRLDGIRRVPLR